MSECKDCEALHGQGAATAPHEQLSCDDVSVRSDGKVETYTCRVCKTRWRRFDRKMTPGAKHEMWTKL